MNLISRFEIENLIRHHNGPCLSFFIPTNKIGPEVQQNPIRLKNMLDKAEEQLRQRGFDAGHVEEFLQPAKELVVTSSFWQHQSDGLAIFLSENIFRPYRLPLHLDPLLMVDDNFYLKPILPLLSGDGRFYILALSQNEVRLLLATRYSVDQIELHGVPKSLAELLESEEPEVITRRQTTRGAASGGPPGTVRATGQQAVFHGQGIDIMNVHKDHILRYFEQIDDGLGEMLGEESRIPMVLAGVDYLLPIYREASDYANLVEEEITGNPELLPLKDLHHKAWEIMRPHFEHAHEEAEGRYRELAGQGSDLASDDLGEIARAASFGRVDTIFVPVDLQRWGQMNPETYEVYVHDERQPQDEDLLDLAATHTFLNDGTVYAVSSDRIPGGGSVAAIFRYGQGAVD